MTLPNFLIIGVQKAGTSSIYEYLKQHPDVYMSPLKETNFLSRDWSLEEPDKQKQRNERLRNQGRRECIDSIEKYRELFDGVTTETAIGEASPNYLFRPQAIAQIKKYVPEAKLIAILRNPVERAYSDYLMHMREEIQGKPLSEQIACYHQHQSFTILKGFYSQQLRLYWQQFDSRKIKVYLYDDLCADPIRMIQDMYDFIGVDSSFQVDISQRKQVAKVPKNRWFNQLLRTQNPIRTTAAAALKQLLPEITRQQIRTQLINWNSQDKRQVSLLTTGDRQQLLEIYRNDIQELQDLINRDLSQWLTA
ncbi:MAG: sulfotransferase [Cyanobacteria bacterium P01_F01_bin.150]